MYKIKFLVKFWNKIIFVKCLQKNIRIAFFFQLYRQFKDVPKLNFIFVFDVETSWKLSWAPDAPKHHPGIPPRRRRSWLDSVRRRSARTNTWTAWVAQVTCLFLHRQNLVTLRFFFKNSYVLDLFEVQLEIKLFFF